MKKTIACSLMVCTLLAPALAQAPSTSIVIKPEAPAVTPGEFHSPAVPRQAPASRDPFVLEMESRERPVHPLPAAAPTRPVTAVTATSRPVTAAVPSPAPPPVTVTGIVSQQAILTAPHQTMIVKVGDRVGDYRVAAVGARSVTLTCQSSTFKIAMPDDVGLK